MFRFSLAAEATSQVRQRICLIVTLLLKLSHVAFGTKTKILIQVMTTPTMWEQWSSGEFKRSTRVDLHLNGNVSQFRACLRHERPFLPGNSMR